MRSHRATGRATRVPALVAAAAMFGVIVAACSSAASLAPAAAPVAAPSAAASAAAFGPATGPTPGGAQGGNGESRSSTGSPADQVGNLTDGQLIVYTGQASLQVNDLDAALASASTAIRGLGGYIAASQRGGTDEQATATITYRIPAARWDDAVAALEKVAAKVLSIQTSSDEVTSQVVDLGARITNLQATELALQAIMTKATKIPDILSIQDQLTSVQGQIEELTAQKTTLEKQAALGTLTVTYNLPPTAVVRVTSGWDPGAEVDHAAATLVGLGQGVANAAIWFGIVGLPLLAIGLVCLAIAFVVARRVRRARPNGLPPAAGPIVPAEPA